MFTRGKLMPKEEMKPRSAILREALEKTKQGDQVGKADKAMFSVPEACAQLGISRWTLYEQFHNGKLKSVKIGNRRLISMRSIEKFIDQLEAEEGA
jgi:excisionase family DNA binding protein